MVAACVMTFEARDRAAKFMSNQLKIIGGNGVAGGGGVSGGGGSSGGPVSGHRGHGRQTPSAGYLSRGDSGRSSYMQNPSDASGRHSKMNKSPSAPNLAATANRLGGPAGRLPLRHKHAVHVLQSPGGGNRTLLSPHALRRQAMSMDTQDYNPFFSPPRSRHGSSGLLTCNTNNNNSGGINNNNINNKQGAGSRESVNDPRARGSHGSMVLDLHVPNECPVTMRVRDRSRRSDTARRHVLRRQTPVELDDAAIIAYAANTAAEHRQRAKRCTRSATCDVPHAVRSKRRRQDSSSSDVMVSRRRSGSPLRGGCGVSSTAIGGFRSSTNDVVDTAEWARTAASRGCCSAKSSPQRVLVDCHHQTTPVHELHGTPTTTAQDVRSDSKVSLSRTCSDIMSIDKSFEESNYSSS